MTELMIVPGMILSTAPYRDLENIYKDPPSGICVVPDNDNITTVISGQPSRCTRMFVIVAASCLDHWSF